MPAKKQAVIRKRKVSVGEVEVLPPQEKRAPANAFKPGNPYRWQKGCNPNPKGGRPKNQLLLVSRALRVQLALQAPHAECLAVGLRPGASWGQVVGAALIRQASRGDVAAAKLILEATEKGTIRTHLPVDAEGNPIPTPSLNIVFTDTDAGEKCLRQELLGVGSVPARTLPYD